MEKNARIFRTDNIYSYKAWNKFTSSWQIVTRRVAAIVHAEGAEIKRTMLRAEYFRYVGR
jgi:hypothetical protein